MIQIYGDYEEELLVNQQFLLISFAPSSIPLKQRWRNNGLSADFVADYMGTFFPISEDDPSTIKKQAELKSAVSYIANELLENAMKFHDQSSEYPIKFGIHLLNETIILFSKNCIELAILERFQSVIKELLESDLGELYIQQLEKVAEAEQENYTTNSGLGLITIMYDYLAKLGWKIETLSASKVTIVTTMVQLTA
ncbi:ATP-binding protein [Aphanothece hegewaldii CCALA 016]|uniref:ATP-binding protein n=1 Tax=Aphanothece hegewaldii CCALA 016 TaxID=2107694 RepID=A0A2T1M3Q6_9CHRO|nr:DUF6272 family protein [Aphanothece hegewaldii]PSF39465.1 ATP-binding protein [Aphanothece hegewaldii CCALA 016]